MELKQGTQIMSDMVGVSMYASVQSVARRVRAVDSVQIKSGQTASQVKNVPVLQVQSVEQSVRAESFQSSEKGTGRRQVYGRSHYYVRSNGRGTHTWRAVYALPGSLHEKFSIIRREYEYTREATQGHDDWP